MSPLDVDDTEKMKVLFGAIFFDARGATRELISCDRLVPEFRLDPDNLGSRVAEPPRSSVLPVLRQKALSAPWINSAVS